MSRSSKEVNLWCLLVSAELYHGSQRYLARRGLHALALIESRIRKDTYKVKPHLSSGKPRLSFHSLPREVREQIAYQLQDNTFDEIEKARRRKPEFSFTSKERYFDSDDEDFWENDDPDLNSSAVIEGFMMLFFIIFAHYDYDSQIECDCNFPVSSPRYSAKLDSPQR